MKTGFLTLLMATAMAAVTAAESPREMIDVLKSNAPSAEKAITCKRLAVYGDKDAVPALAPLLADPQLASWARIALEAIPDPAAADALRAALNTLQGNLLVGAINSLGVLRDAKSVPALIKIKSDDPLVIGAAADALGRIGGVDAAMALVTGLGSVPVQARADVAYGCIRCGEGLLAAGQRDIAVKVYEAVRSSDVPRQRKLEATRGLILARQAAGIPLLVELLHAPDSDPKLIRLGLRVTRELPGPEVTKMLIAELDQAALERRPNLLLALADRGGAEVVPAAIKAAKTGNPELSTVAIDVLERQGGAAVVPVLFEIASADIGGAGATAKLALCRLPGAEVDAAAVALLNNPAPASRRLAIELVTQRHVAAAVPALLQAARDADPKVRLASLKALGDLAGPAELPALLELLVKNAAPAEMPAAEAAVIAISLRSAEPVAGSITVTKAVYGDQANQHTADVTQKVADAVKRGATTVTASNSEFGDPAGGVVKQLRVDYQINGQKFSKTCAESATITLAANIVSPACANAVLAALPGTQGPAKLAMLRILRSIGGQRALAAVLAATTDADAATQTAALRLLCDWPDAEALPKLAQLAKSATDPVIKILALRGYVRLADQSEAATDQKLAKLKDALALAGRDEERKLVLAALGKVRSVDSLALVSPYLDSPALKEEAALAAVAIAENLPAPRPAQVASAMRQVVKVTANAQLAQRAKALAGN
jgi:HEAT repeat protein